MRRLFHSFANEMAGGFLACGWVFIALGLPITPKRGVLFSIKCHKNYKIFSLTDTIQDIFLFLTFWFCPDWEFGAMKTQALLRACCWYIDAFSVSQLHVWVSHCVCLPFIFQCRAVLKG
jgi:hypothetical protein